jgi:uncharacterized MAPEG superfamily protein
MEVWMSIELWTVLGCSALVAVLVITQGVLANRIYKPDDLLGARDNLVLDQGMLGRSKRAMANTMEALWMFVPAALVVHITDQGTVTTQIACIIFLISRVIYIPAYLLNPPLLRSGVWFAGLIATLVMIVQAIP